MQRCCRIDQSISLTRWQVFQRGLHRSDARRHVLAQFGEHGPVRITCGDHDPSSSEQAGCLACPSADLEGGPNRAARIGHDHVEQLHGIPRPESFVCFRHHSETQRATRHAQHPDTSGSCGALPSPVAQTRLLRLQARAVSTPNRTRTLAARLPSSYMVWDVRAHLIHGDVLTHPYTERRRLLLDLGAAHGIGSPPQRVPATARSATPKPWTPTSSATPVRPHGHGRRPSDSPMADCVCLSPCPSPWPPGSPHTCGSGLLVASWTASARSPASRFPAGPVGNAASPPPQCRPLSSTPLAGREAAPTSGRNRVRDPGDHPAGHVGSNEPRPSLLSAHPANAPASPRAQSPQRTRVRLLTPPPSWEGE